MKHKIKTHIGKIGSLKDLHSEKLRIKAELQLTEEGITSNYHNIRNAFTFSNVLKTVAEDISIASKAFEFGKMLLGKVKRKKKKKQEETRS
jgi:hypothetical protein